MQSKFKNLLRTAALTACAMLPWMASGQTAAMPAMKSQGSALYLCGGIGSDESTAMRAAMKDHPLALLFARADGAYLSEVAVTIKNASGTPALELRAAGPVCLIDLPAGRYTVEAKSEGASKSRGVTVGGGSKTVDFRF